MTTARRRRFSAVLALTALLGMAAPLAAQPPAPLATTAVLVNLTVKPDVDRAKMQGVMPGEVRDTVQLYLDGKIQQWYAKADGRGVMFILNVTTVSEAKTLMEALPLGKGGFATFEYTALTPLSPLRLLIAPPAATPKGDQKQ